MDKIEVTNGAVDPDHYGPIGDAARGIASYCDDPQRVHVYTAAFDAIKDILATRTDATPVADSDETFLTAYVSANTNIIGIDHPTEAPWQQVYDAHLALRDRLNERLEQEDLCPYKPKAGTDTHPPATDVAALVEAAMETNAALERDGDPAFAHLILANKAALAPFTKG